ncbi:hypothetical protein [Streptomyces violaceusniger]|uniref:Uncharacterized protein n=1 Tax=Streptomyces violaceusniger TaxID=68280 RepID=A0A4D4L3I1_STRVO|nr:hypothetical protein SVIO_032120 [Streptomyces violaceusniger]
MGLDVYIENQVHDRSQAGPEAGDWLASLLPFATEGGQLYGVFEYGDTMFNIVQLRQLLGELEKIAIAVPGTKPAVAGLTDLIDAVIRRRGYLWISGD